MNILAYLCLFSKFAYSYVLSSFSHLHSFLLYPICSSDDGWNRDTRDDYDHETDRHYHRRNHSPDSHGQNRGRGAGFQQRRSRSRDDLMAMDRNDRGNEYDDRLLREALAKKKLGSQDRLDHSGEKRPMNGHYGPPPLPVSPPSGYPEHFPSSLPYDQESTASSKKSNLRKVSQQH